MTPLRQRMLEDMQIRNLSPHTQRAYLESVARFARHFRQSPTALGPEEIRIYQVYLIRERKLAPSSLGIAVCALRFLYKVSLKKPWSFDDLIPAPKKSWVLPVVLSQDEVISFLAGVTAPLHRTILTTCYATGLRISEALHLRPTDIDSRRMVIRVKQGKGQRDRYVMLSPRLLAILREWWRVRQPAGRGAARLPGCAPPGALGQTHHAPFFETRVRRTSPGSGRRCPHHSAVARPSQSRHHRALSVPRHDEGLCDDQPARPAPVSRSVLHAAAG
jgi:integrase